MAKKRFTATEVADAIRETNGFITYTAKRLGCSRGTVYGYINEHDICKEAVDDARAGFLDVAEMTLLNKVKEGDVTAVIFALKTLGKDRGYSQRHEYTGAGNNAIEIKLTYDDNDNDYS